MIISRHTDPFLDAETVKKWKYTTQNGYILIIFRLTYGYFITIIMLTDVLGFS